MRYVVLVAVTLILDSQKRDFFAGLVLKCVVEYYHQILKLRLELRTNMDNEGEKEGMGRRRGGGEGGEGEKEGRGRRRGWGGEGEGEKEGRGRRRGGGEGGEGEKEGRGRRRGGGEGGEGEKEGRGRRRGGVRGRKGCGFGCLQVLDWTLADCIATA